MAGENPNCTLNKDSLTRSRVGCTRLPLSPVNLVILACFAPIPINESHAAHP